MIARIGLVLEIIGTILLASSLAGPERVQRWEGKIRTYLNYRSNVTAIAKFTEASGCLAVYIVVLSACLIFTTRPVYFYDRLNLDPIFGTVLFWLFGPARLQNDCIPITKEATQQA
jgi:hypothetical protein